ncbi:hypothetical protein HIM_03205 [Hirsutella minnesotensis 3608]|nr:hypothetical protein HIM_03205 [Hirsutella minnesotensis 3608]
MLPTSMRRVVSAAPQAASLASSLSAAAAPKTVAGCVASAPVLLRGHQRRFSSSKPSRPDNGDVASGQSVPASSASARADGKSGSDKKKRSRKDSSERNAAFKKLPFVPNTQHMSHEALGLSSFFSLHRPISVTQTMPRPVTDEHFASIFAPLTKANKMANAMTTLSDTIDQLEGPMAQLTIGHPEDSHAAADGLRKVQFRNPDGTESSIYLQVDNMSGDFLPFRPPPLPRPQTIAEVDETAAEFEGADEGARKSVYKATVMIEEFVQPDGQIRVVAHSPRILCDDQPTSFLERMARRQLQFEDAQARRDLHAISVKRQRKLKMKKKKYKKLMKRTRNLRRKLDRT